MLLPQLDAHTGTHRLVLLLQPNAYIHRHTHPVFFPVPACCPSDKYFTLGDHPVRVAGMKVYSTSDDSTILEVPVMWGSNAVVRACAGGVLGKG